MSALALWAAAAVLGGAASVARLLLDRAAQSRGATELGGTLLVNVCGSLVLGLLTGGGIAGDALLLTGTAVLGSFTTFSTWIDGSRRLGETRGAETMCWSLAACMTAGLLAALAGRAFGTLP